MNRWRLVLLVCSVLLLFPTAVTAQTPEAGRIRSTRGVMVLPSAIRFRVRVMAPHEQVEAVALHLEQDAGLREIIYLDLEAAKFGDYGTEIEYEYVWDVAQQPELRLFQDLSFRFEVLTTDGVLSEFEDTVFVALQDVGLWQTSTNQGLNLYWPEELQLSGDSHAENLTEVLNLLSTQTGIEQPPSLALYPSDTQFCETITDPETGEPQSVVKSGPMTYPCDPTAMQHLHQAASVVPVMLPSLAYTDVANSLVDSLVAYYYADQWQDSDVPAWFMRGLSLLYGTSGQDGLLGDAKRAALEDRLLSLRAMSTPQPDDLWEAQAYLLTLYIADTYGATAPFDIALGIDGGFDETVEWVTGDSIDRIYRAWALVWLDSRQAADAIRWNPYLETTSTPTPSLTPSPIPPTRTPVPTSTITLTPTPRRYVPPSPTHQNLVRSPTPRPTVSPTPLPPGFFDTPTATPETTTEDGSGGDGVCGTGIGALLLPVAAFIMSRRKRR